MVELSAAKNAGIKYSTVQNWYPGDAEGKGGIYNFVTKRALCHGANSKVSWTQVKSSACNTGVGSLAKEAGMIAAVAMHLDLECVMCWLCFKLS